jgi:hypothetical protein
MKQFPSRLILAQSVVPPVNHAVNAELMAPVLNFLDEIWMLGNSLTDYEERGGGARLVQGLQHLDCVAVVGPVIERQSGLRRGIQVDHARHLAPSTFSRSTPIVEPLAYGLGEGTTKLTTVHHEGLLH